MTQCLQTPRPAPKTLGRRSGALGPLPLRGPSVCPRTSPPRARPAPWPPALCSSGEAAGQAGSSPVLVPRLQPNRRLLGCFSPSRSQDPTPSSAPQEASGGGKVAEPSGQHGPLPPPASPRCPPAWHPLLRLRLCLPQPPARPWSASGTSRPPSEGQTPPPAPWTGDLLGTASGGPRGEVNKAWPLGLSPSSCSKGPWQDRPGLSGCACAHRSHIGPCCPGPPAHAHL